MYITFVSIDRISLAPLAPTTSFHQAEGALHFDIKSHVVRINGPDDNGKFTITLTGSPTKAPAPDDVV